MQKPSVLFILVRIYPVQLCCQKNDTLSAILPGHIAECNGGDVHSFALLVNILNSSLHTGLHFLFLLKISFVGSSAASLAEAALLFGDEIKCHGFHVHYLSGAINALTCSVNTDLHCRFLLSKYLFCYVYWGCHTARRSSLVTVSASGVLRDLLHSVQLLCEQVPPVRCFCVPPEPASRDRC